ncbi:MAG: hypothetical protein ACE5F9_12310 [Phycisphaerae bacterium]
MISVALSASAPAAPRSILRLVPADCIVVYTAKPYTDWVPAARPMTTAPARGGSQLAAILGFLNASGLIPHQGQVYADIAARLPLLGRYEHAIALLDVSSKLVRKQGRTPADRNISLRLKQLQAAVLFRTNGENSDVLDHLNEIVGRYTNSDVAHLMTEKAGKHTYRRLVDDRLIGWAIWEWGRLGEFFVVTFGAGAFDRIADTYDGRASSLAEDDWFKSATRKTHGDRALAQWFVSLSRLETSLLEPGLSDAAQKRYRGVISALGAAGMTHDLWTVGLPGRAMSWYRCFQRQVSGGPDRDETRVYSDPERYPKSLRRIVPDAATRFAIIHVPTRWLVDNLPRAWVQAQSERHVQRLHAAWERLEEETGIDISSNLVRHLGENVVIFDYPPHPLRVPVALTVVIEIDDRKAVEAATDALLGAWGRYLDERAERKGTTLLRMYVKHDDDGVWYIEAGILGPALKVTDRYLVLSWSPAALREALDAMGRGSTSGRRSGG